MIRHPLILTSLVCLVSTAAVAEQKTVGQATTEWLQLQQSGEQAPSDARPLSGDVAKRNYQRYLKSFEIEIPAQFDTGIKVSEE